MFSKFLDANPIIRTIVLRAINPQIWASEHLPADFTSQSPYNLEVVSEYKEGSYDILLKDSKNDKVIDSGILECSEMDFLEGERNRRDEPADVMMHSGELKKMGRQTKLWLSRYYVLRDNCLLAFQSKSDKAPKRKFQMTV